MLVATFEIHVTLERLPVAAQLRPPSNYGSGRGSRVDPHVEGIARLCDTLSPGPIRRLEERPKFVDVFFKPDVRSVLLDQIRCATHNSGVEDGLSVRIVKCRDGDTPGALA